MSELRPYQNEAIAAGVSALGRVRTALLVLPTGTGKTVIFAKLAEAFASSGRVLVLAHREELVRQAVDKIQSWTALKCGIEMADAKVSLDSLFAPDVVVASVQSISRPTRLARYTEWDFGLIVVDEAHHAIASTYRDILKYFSAAKVLGVTATPDRGDKGALGMVFEECPFVYEIRDAIEGGFLSPIKQKAVEVEGLDLSKVRTTAGDLNEGDLEKLLRKDEHLHKIAGPIAELAGERKTLVFGVTVEHAHDLARTINGYAGKGKAEALDGSADRESRAEVLGRFRRGEFQFLVNCALFTEGFDEPSIACVAVARPTKSRLLYTQMVGRGTRLSPETGKQDLLVLDFEGNAGKHSLVCALDVLDGNTDGEVRERAKELTASRPGITVLDALDEATSDIAEKRRKDAERRALLAERVRDGTDVQVGTKKRVTDVDPFAVIGLTPRRREGGALATSSQRLFLERMGFPAGEDLQKREASEAIDKLLTRRKDGLCTFKQAKLLLRYGMSADVSYEMAKRQIDEIAANGWKKPKKPAAEPAAGGAVP